MPNCVYTWSRGVLDKRRVTYLSSITVKTIRCNHVPGSRPAFLSVRRSSTHRRMNELPRDVTSRVLLHVRWRHCASPLRAIPRLRCRRRVSRLQRRLNNVRWGIDAVWPATRCGPPTCLARRPADVSGGVSSQAIPPRSRSQTLTASGRKPRRAATCMIQSPRRTFHVDRRPRLHTAPIGDVRRLVSVGS